MKEFVKKNWIILVLIGLITLSVVVYVRVSQDTIVFIELKKVVDSFSYKKELEAEFDIIKTNLSKQADSLETLVRVSYTQLENEQNKKEKDILIAKYNTLFSHYEIIKEKSEKEIQVVADNLNTKMYQKLNSLIKEYGIANNIDFILGTQSNGNIMYADDAKNVSDDVILFINNTNEKK